METAAGGAYGALWRLFGAAKTVALDPWGLNTAQRFEAAAWVPWVLAWLYVYVASNVALMVFNLVPVPPLDGSRIATVLLPRRLAARYARLERFGLLLVFALFWLPGSSEALSSAVGWILARLGMQ